MRGAQRLHGVVGDDIHHNGAFFLCQNFGYFYTSLNELKYPGSVIKGSYEYPKHVIIMTDIFAISLGDLFPNLFTGIGDDNDLGNNVFAHVVGCMDGRSSYATVNSFPVNNNTTWKDVSGNPVTPLNFWSDYSIFWRYGDQKISMDVQNEQLKPLRTPSVSGSNGGAPLPISYEATILQDLGYNTITRPPIPGWDDRSSPIPSNRTTWRFLYLEASIETAIKLSMR